MKGGRFSDVSFTMRILFLFCFLSFCLVTFSYSLLKKQTKTICKVSLQTSPGQDKEARAKLDHLCGPAVKVNTLQDVSFVFMTAGVALFACVWIFSILKIVKAQWWNCALRGSCDTINEIYWMFAIFGTFIMVFLVPGFVNVSRSRQRVCRGTPSTNCKSSAYNQDNLSFILFSSVMIALATVYVLISMFMTTDDGI